jgi:Cu/Ag efflux pump CusA
MKAFSAIATVLLPFLLAAWAFIPLTYSVFWGTLAYTLIGGTFGGTVLTLVFLPALYAIWFKIKVSTDAVESTNKFDQANVSSHRPAVT